MIAYVIRNKTTGQFLSYRPSGGKRQWGGMDKVGLFRRKCDVSNALRYIPEVAQWMKDNGRRWIPRWMQDKLPVEVLQFTVVLINNGVGYINKEDLKAALND